MVQFNFKNFDCTQFYELCLEDKNLLFGAKINIISTFRRQEGDKTAFFFIKTEVPIFL